MYVHVCEQVCVKEESGGRGEGEREERKSERENE